MFAMITRFSELAAISPTKKHNRTADSQSRVIHPIPFERYRLFWFYLGTV